MKLKIGSYSFSIPLPDISISRADTDWGYTVNWTVDGVLVAEGYASLKTARDSFQAALTDNTDIKLTDDSEVVVLDSIISANTANGIILKNLEYSTTIAGNWISNRLFKFGLEAKYKSRTGDTIVFTETIDQTPAIVTKVFIEDIDGTTTPAKQTTTLQPANATQSGSAIGLTAYPSYPAYKYDSTHLISSRKTKEAPKRLRSGTLTEYKISWTYDYRFSSDPSDVNPTEPPA